MIRFTFTLLLLFFFAMNSAAEQSNFSALFKAAEKNLNDWQVQEASEISDKALKAAKNKVDEANTYYLKSQIEFYKGDYIRAQEYANKADTVFSQDREFVEYMDYLLQVSETGEKFKEVKAEHFIFRYSHPKDSILVDYARDALDKAYREIGLDLGIQPAEPVIVEIYPNIESFSTASTLSEDEIRTTGVVGICKFNRVMILSPRLLAQGYRWLDTLAHEYTHYLIFLKSGNSVPVWMHEGIAKFQEKRWREKKRDVLNPLFETLLAQALKGNKLVPMEKMHPSLGKLKSAYEAQLAFAQVSTMVDFLVRKWGSNSLVDMLQAMRGKNDYKAAIRKVTKTDFQTFYNLWLADLKSKKLKERIPQLEVKELKFASDDKNKEKAEEESQDLADVDNTNARDYTRLGDMLRDRGRFKAAVYEYEKAVQAEPMSPIVLNRLASAQSATGEYEKAEVRLKPLLEFYPEYVETYKNLGKIYLKKKNLSKAKKAYEEAVGINPFDPEIHVTLVYIYNQLKLTDLEEAEKKVITTLRSQ